MDSWQSDIVCGVAHGFALGSAHMLAMQGTMASSSSYCCDNLGISFIFSL